MASHRITNDLLNFTVGIKLENGVSARQVRSLIDEFTAEQQSKHGGSDIYGFLWVDDVPESRRGEFLAAVATLAPLPGEVPPEPRMLSAATIWESRLSA